MPVCSSVDWLSFVIVNESSSTNIEESLLFLENPAECPSSCLPIAMQPVSVFIDSAASLHLSGYTDAQLPMSQST